MQILRRSVLLPILTSVKAHKLFGGFKLQYDPEFREFLLANIDTILTTSEYTNYLASIQGQFKNIKAMNSNRVLTLDLAVSYVQQNKYASIEVGNERMAEISSIAGYDQEDFEVLQQIYNYGKQRVFSSIPRVENEREMKSGKYTYEILRLDDPLAMAIGTLTDCCQELGDAAEVCMEHSMVDKNGRVFVIKDSESNIVAQSWVWRNKDVLCFDNIEIPDKAFKRFTKGHQELDRSDFTDDIYELYKQAAEELIMEDEKIYKSLLDSEKITEEQYNSLRLGKITVGLGYNDIAESIKKKAKLDKGTLTAPLPFEPPVELSRGLYTSDSRTQYILKERDDRREYDGDALPVHSDTYKELSNSNFNEVLLHSLQRLEIATKGRSYDLDTEIDEKVDKEHIVTELADNYDLNPETTRIIMNPNFAIIYDINGNTVRIADLLFNVVIGDGCEQKDISDIVLLQIRLALEQIAGDKEIDVSRLSEEQLEMYQKAISLTNEMDIERGVSGGR